LPFKQLTRRGRLRRTRTRGCDLAGSGVFPRDIEFEDHGKVEVKDGELIIGKGIPMSGVSWKGDFPRTDYEVSLKGKRIEGDDFFCGMTFPVDKSHCSLIRGGWDGSTTGLLFPWCTSILIA